MQRARVDLGPEIIAAGQHFLDFGFKSGGVKVRIRDRHEQGFQNLMVDAAQLFAVEFALHNDFCDSLQGIDQQILKLGDFFRFAADSPNLTACALGGLLTLIAEHAHGKSPFSNFG